MGDSNASCINSYFSAFEKARLNLREITARLYHMRNDRQNLIQEMISAQIYRHYYNNESNHYIAERN